MKADGELTPVEFTVGIPVFNGEQTILRSVSSVLKQSFERFELIVVDDGSTDATSELLAQVTDPRLMVLRQANAGVSAARAAREAPCTRLRNSVLAGDPSAGRRVFSPGVA